MAGTKIPWCDTVWNPVRGVSKGCRHCYAERQAARSLPGLRSPTSGESFAVMTAIGPRWTGKVELIESKLKEPLRWKNPRRIFVNSMSDLFHESLPDQAIDGVFAVMALCPQHTFIVLTKRAKRMYEYVSGVNGAKRFHDINVAAQQICGSPHYGAVLPTQCDGMVPGGWPLPNVVLVVSCEDQKTADERIPWLVKTPAACRGVSLEPLLGPINLVQHLFVPKYPDARPEMQELYREQWKRNHSILDWVIVGGESGPGARPMDPDWARSIRDQCQVAGVAFFFKQHGEWIGELGSGEWSRSSIPVQSLGDGRVVRRVGKKAAGRLLDGREWNEFPD